MKFLKEKPMRTFSLNILSIVAFKSPSQHHDRLFSCSCGTTYTFCRLTVLVTCLEKFFILGHALTTNFSSEGNSKTQLSEVQKLLRLFSDTSSRTFSCLKTMSTFPSFCSSFPTISSRDSHLITFMVLR